MGWVIVGLGLLLCAGLGAAMLSGRDQAVLGLTLGLLLGPLGVVLAIVIAALDRAPATRPCAICQAPMPADGLRCPTCGQWYERRRV